MNTDITHFLQDLRLTVIALNELPLDKLDTDTTLLNEAFQIVQNHNLFSLHTYDESLQDKLKLELFSALCPLSGSLAFLIIQTLAANRIMQGNKFIKSDEYYKKQCGIIINHLRVPKTVISSTKTETGYKLNGHLTWASGYQIFDTLVVGFHCEGVEMQAVMPFEQQNGCNIGQRDETLVGISMNTVSIKLDNLFIPHENIINTQPIGVYTQQKSISKTVHIALYGIGLGAIEVIKDSELKEEASKRLEFQKDAFMRTTDGNEMNKLRIDLFTLIQKIITTAMTLIGGKSILSSEMLQRYYREIIMFNSNGLNSEIKQLFKEAF